MRHLLSLVFIGGFSLTITAQTPAFTSLVLNAESAASGPIAPREIVTIFGTSLGPALCSSQPPYPTTCGGSSVLVNGTAVPLVFVRSAQINFQVPVDLSGASATVQVTTQVNGQTLQSPILTVPVAAVAPGLASTVTTGLGIGLFLGPGSNQITASNPAHSGDILTAFATGFGATNPVGTSGSAAPANAKLLASVTVTVGNQTANVLFAGPDPVSPGLDVVNFAVPQSAAAGNLPVVVTVGGQPSQTVLLPVAGAVPPTPTITGISNSASGAASFESGSWVSIYGTNLSATTRSWQSSDFSGINLPTALDTVSSVKINGKNAAISYISPVQLNVQAPTDSSTGPVQVQVTNSFGTVTGVATLQTYSPGFFMFQGAKYAAAVHADGVYGAPVGYFGAGVVSRPAQPGEILQIYGTGFGPTTPAIPAGQIPSAAAPLSDPTQLRLTIGGVTATVQFAGISAVGEYQFNVVVPQLPDGDRPIVATIGGVSSQIGISVPIKN